MPRKKETIKRGGWSSEPQPPETDKLLYDRYRPTKDFSDLQNRLRLLTDLLHSGKISKEEALELKELLSKDYMVETSQGTEHRALTHRPEYQEELRDKARAAISTAPSERRPLPSPSLSGWLKLISTGVYPGTDYTTEGEYVPLRKDISEMIRVSNPKQARPLDYFEQEYPWMQDSGDSSWEKAQEQVKPLEKEGTTEDIIKNLSGIRYNEITDFPRATPSPEKMDNLRKLLKKSDPEPLSVLSPEEMRRLEEEEAKRRALASLTTSSS